MLRKKRAGNRLEPIKPFNYMWVGTCFHHAVCAVLPYFGVDHKQFLLANYEFFGDGLTFRRMLDRTSEQIFDDLGLQLEDVCFDGPESVMDYIDAGVPVIAGMDCYYIRHRTDTFGKTHANHFLLIFGYERRKKRFLTIDHGYVNSPIFYEMPLAFSVFREGNAAFAEYFGRNGSGGKVIRRAKDRAPADPQFERRLCADADAIDKSQAALERNLREITDSLEVPYETFTKRQSGIYDYIVQSMRNRSILVRAAGLLPVAEAGGAAERLTEKYMRLQAAVGRLGYKSNEAAFRAAKPGIGRLVAEILAGERQLHALLKLCGERYEQKT